MAAEHRAVVVERMLYADLHGIDSHGCCMLPFYQRLRSEGRLNTAARIEVVHETEDDRARRRGGGLGHVPATIAMERAIAKCRSAGVGAVAVRNSGHFGAAGYYVRAWPFEQGLIADRDDEHADARSGADVRPRRDARHEPLAFAAPAAAIAPSVLDMATSAASPREDGGAVADWAPHPHGLGGRRGRTADHERTDGGEGRARATRR
jgi:LDH2 family malate/lactate/ureidoglycolate dehydrogenase